MPTFESDAACEVYDKCVSSLAEYVQNAGFEDVVIGLSGGIDSSLVATMAVDAFGQGHVHGVLLPGPYSSEGSIQDAKALADNLGISSMTIPIEGAYTAFCEGFEQATREALSGLASENTQARCRMVYLMALSNGRGWLMLNTGNKSEAAMGYSTLYGDTAGAFAPIGGLYKTQVFELSRWRNDLARKKGEVPPIPDQVLTKPPSAELSSGQTDEESMGISYAELDSILRLYLDEGAEAAEIKQQGHPEELVDMVVRRYGANAFKRALEPPYAEV